MLHLGLHLAVPLLIARLAYSERWLRVSAILLATMLVDLDHLLATPIYDPARCSIGFHPLHTLPAIAIYALLFALPLLLTRRRKTSGLPSRAWYLHLVGLGLLLHMALDWVDCLV